MACCYVCIWHGITRLRYSHSPLIAEAVAGCGMLRSVLSNNRLRWLAGHKALAGTEGTYWVGAEGWKDYLSGAGRDKQVGNCEGPACALVLCVRDEKEVCICGVSQPSLFAVKCACDRQGLLRTDPANSFCLWREHFEVPHLDGMLGHGAASSILSMHCWIHIRVKWCRCAQVPAGSSCSSRCAHVTKGM